MLESEKVKTTCNNFKENDKYLNVTVISNLISVFDRHNIPSNSFIRECKRAKNLVDAKDKALLFRLIISEIKGKAEAYLENHKVTNLEELSSVLKRAYDPSRSIPELQTELNCISQRLNESIFEIA